MDMNQCLTLSFDRLTKLMYDEIENENDLMTFEHESFALEM